MPVSHLVWVLPLFNYGQILHCIYTIYDTLGIVIVLWSLLMLSFYRLVRPRIFLSQLLVRTSPESSRTVSQSDLCFQKFLSVCNVLYILEYVLFPGTQLVLCLSP